MLALHLLEPHDPKSPRRAIGTREHQILLKLVGDWTYRQQLDESTSASSTQSSGTMHRQAFGHIGVQCNWTGEAGAEGYRAFEFLGYDRDADEYQGLWLDNSSGYRWLLQVDFDLIKGEIHLRTEGPGPAGPKTLFRETYVFSGDTAVSIIAYTQQGSDWKLYSTTELTRRVDGQS